jgi:hypothetical protein
MKLGRGRKGIAITVLAVAGALTYGNASRTQDKVPGDKSITPRIEDISGEYECTEARVAGKSAPCRVAQLSLRSDGRFELAGREGEYLVTGNWVELTGTLLKSRAKIEAGHKIVFRFYNKKGLCEMIYERRVAELGKTKLG